MAEALPVTLARRWLPIQVGVALTQGVAVRVGLRATARSTAALSTPPLGALVVEQAVLMALQMTGLRAVVPCTLKLLVRLP